MKPAPTLCIDLGFDRLSTSGQKQTAIEGADWIQKLIEKAGERIVILAGSGVNAENIATLKEKTNFKNPPTSPPLL